MKDRDWDRKIAGASSIHRKLHEMAHGGVCAIHDRTTHSWPRLVFFGWEAEATGEGIEQQVWREVRTNLSKSDQGVM